MKEKQQNQFVPVPEMNRRTFLKASCVGSAIALLGIPIGSKRAFGEIPSFTIAQASSITSLNPYRLTERVVHVVNDVIYDPLVRRDKKNNLIPCLAEKYEFVENQNWKFYLRKGVTFHNGKPFNAHSVKYTIEKQLKSPKAVRSSEYATVSEVKIIDDYTVVFVCGKPYVTLPNLLTFASMGYEEYFESHDDAYLATHAMGTGPFKFVDWIKDDSIILERNEQYWAGKSEIKRLIFKEVVEVSTRVAALLSGQMDIITYVPPHLWESVNSSKNARISTSIGGRVVTVQINLDKKQKPVDDVRVRQALNYAINKEIINGKILGGKAEIIGQPVGSSVFGYDPSIKPYPYDPDKARSLLKEAGYPNGFEINFDVAKGMALNDIQIAETIVAQLKEVGVKANLTLHEWTAYQTKIKERQVGPLMLLSHGGWSTFDASSYLKGLYYTGIAWSFYSNPEIDRLIDESLAEYSPEKRKQIFSKTMAILHDECPMIYLHVQPNAYGVNRAYSWEAQPDEMIPVFDVKKI